MTEIIFIVYPGTMATVKPKELVVITGGTGLIGSAITDKLSGKYKVAALDMTCSSHPTVKAECVYLDLSSDESVKQAFERIRYAYGNTINSVIHLAAFYDFSGKSSPHYRRINIEGTARLLDTLQHFEVEQIIYSSSLLVYKAVIPGQKINELSPLEPQWEYPKSKVEAEKILFGQRGKIPVMNLRIAGVYTTYCNSLPVSNHIKRIYERQISSHFYPGDFNCGSPYVYLDDLTDAIVKSVENRKQLPTVCTLNIGEPRALSFIELQQRIAHLLWNKNWQTYRIPKIMAAVGARVQNLFSDEFIKPWMVWMADDHMELDIQKARDILNWEPQKNLYDMLPEMINLLRKNPQYWYLRNKFA